jgi:hypothetical protein
MSDDKKVLTLKAVKASKQGIDPKMIETVMEFLEAMEDSDVKGFAAVAVGDHGVILDTWYSSISPATMIGAVEMLKNDYIMRHWIDVAEEYSTDED